MTTQPARDLEAVLAEMALTVVSLRQAEKELGDLRAHSRKLTLELITEHRVSAAKAAQYSGHHRATIKIWLDLWNAEHKSAQKKT